MIKIHNILGSFLVNVVVFDASRIGHFEGILLHPGAVCPTRVDAVITRGGSAALLVGVTPSHILISDKIAVRSFVLALLRSIHHLLFLIVVL